MFRSVLPVFFFLFCLVGVPPLYSQTADIPELIQKVRQSVVNIQTDRSYAFGSVQQPSFMVRFFYDFSESKEFQRQFFNFQSYGAGVVLDASGLVLTNAHVVAGAKKIQVILSDQSVLEAILIGKNNKEDLALLKVNSSQALIEIPWGRSETLRQGEEVFAIGAPYGYSDTVTRGIISATQREIKEGNKIISQDLIQTDASIHPGNSGGPLLNVKGEMIGIVSMGDSRGPGINFAIPVDKIKSLIPDLKTHEKEMAALLSFRDRFGFLPEDEQTEDGSNEVVIQEVSSGSKAERAGLQKGDILSQFRKKTIGTVEELFKEAAKAGEKEPICLVLRRGKRTFFTYLEVLK